MDILQGRHDHREHRGRIIDTDKNGFAVLPNGTLAGNVKTEEGLGGVQRGILRKGDWRK